MQTRIAEELTERPLAGRREKAATEVDAILAAGEVVLARQGFGGLRVEDVLAEAGLSTRAFYRHFRGKSELFLALFDRESARADSRLRAKIARAGEDPVARVRAWIEATIALAFDPRLARRTRLFGRERHEITSEFPEQVARCVQVVRAPLEAAIADGRDDGSFPGADPEKDALAIHHVCAGLGADRLDGTTSLDRSEASALVERFALTTLRNGESR